MIRIAFFLLLISSCGKPITEKDSENVFKSPLLEGVDEEILLETKMSLNFDLLPLKGEVRRDGRFWSGDSWPLRQGAINKRWNSENKAGFDYNSPSRREALSLPPESFKTLSPSEKYDLWMGRYDYPLKREVDLLARSGTMNWEGLCHGFAGASMNYPEPGPKMMTNPDGIQIPFGSADIKALLTYAYSKVLIREDESIGKRCEDDQSTEDKCDDDLTAISFHVVLANKLGLRGQSVIADLDRSKEVWNHPIIAYETKPKSIVSASFGKKAILSTKMSYVDVLSKNSWEKNRDPMISYMTVEYELHIDKAGNIIRGKWLSPTRPDFFWTVDRVEKFDGYLAGVSELMK